MTKMSMTVHIDAMPHATLAQREDILDVLRTAVQQYAEDNDIYLKPGWRVVWDGAVDVTFRLEQPASDTAPEPVLQSNVPWYEQRLKKPLRKGRK